MRMISRLIMLFQLICFSSGSENPAPHPSRLFTGKERVGVGGMEFSCHAFIVFFPKPTTRSLFRGVNHTLFITLFITAPALCLLIPCSQTAGIIKTQENEGSGWGKAGGGAAVEREHDH